MNTPRARASWRHWAVLGFFLLLAILLSWPVAANVSTRIPGTATWAFDESTFVWNNWYFKHSLLDLGSSPLHTELIWYPLGIDLILYTYNYFNAALGLPLLLVAGAPAASNITLWLATALSGFGAYLLTLDTLHAAGRASQPGTRVAAIIAGLAYAFGSNRAIYAALGHYDMVTTQWIPFYALFALRALRTGSWRPAALAGMFFALAAYAEMTFAVFLVILTLIFIVFGDRSGRDSASIGALTLRRRPGSSSWGRTVAVLALMGAIAALVWSPVLVPVLREMARGDYSLKGWGESIKLSADLVGLGTPTELNPVLAPGRAAQPEAAARWQQALRQVETGDSRFSDINTVFLGWVTLALALLGAVTAGRAARPWRWAAAVFGVLALGPLLQIIGRYRFDLDGLLPEGVTFPLPAAILHYLPVINANRAPNRYSVALMLGLAVLAGFGVAWLMARAARTPAVSGRRMPVWAGGLAVVAALAILFEHLALPLPTTAATIPAVYRQIAAESGEFAIMQLPLGWRNSFGVLGSEQTQLQYFQTAHGKPMIGGNISRAPDLKMAYFARIPLFRAITDLEMYRTVPPEVDAAARAQAADLAALYDIRYFVTTPPIPGRYPYTDTWQATEAYALDVLPLEKPAAWESDGYAAYRVRQAPVVLPFRTDAGIAGAEPYLGAGWDVRTDEQPYGATANWSANRKAELILPLAAPGDVTLRLMLAPLDYPGAPQQRVTIAVNETAVLESAALAPGWQVVEAAVPAAATRRGPNRVALRFDHAASPRLVFPRSSERAEIGATGVVSPVNIELHAFGEAFMTSTAEDGTVEDLSAGRAGYNVAVIDRRTGRLLDRRGFDTTANPYEADALAAYLRQVPEGRIVAVATKGDAGAHLTSGAVEAMRGLGSAVLSPADLAGRAHALVGIQGASPGDASEALASGDAFLRVAGDFRTLAAALDWAELAPGR